MGSKQYSNIKQLRGDSSSIIILIFQSKDGKTQLESTSLLPGGFMLGTTCSRLAWGLPPSCALDHMLGLEPSLMCGLMLPPYLHRTAP